MSEFPAFAPLFVVASLLLLFFVVVIVPHRSPGISPEFEHTGKQLSQVKQ